MLEFILAFIPTNPVWILVIFIACLLVFKEYQRNKGLPPGPYGLPFIGYMFSIQPTRISRQIDDLCQKYNTDILSINILRTQLISFNSLELTREVFQRRTDVADRSDLGLFSIVDPEFSGIIGTSGRQWKEVRRFSISALRDFGMGRVGAEDQIQREAQVLCDLIKKHNGQAMNPKEYIGIAVSNIICGLVFGQRFEHDDDDFLRALDGIGKYLKSAGRPTFLLFKYKLFRQLLKGQYQEMVRDFQPFQQFVRKRIEEHKATYTGEKTDVIYSYLKEMEEGREPDIFDEKMMESLIADYFFAGSETTYTTLRWALLAMAAYPDVQKKVQQELDEVIGEKEVTMSEKKQTPYCEATLCEIQRHYTLLPLGVTHSNLHSDIVINDYRIPKGSFIIANLNKIHHDEKNWKNPMEFDPGHFFQDGRMVNTEKLVPFGIGRRSCAGEALARMELYLFFATLVKNFDIRPETDDTKPDMVGKEFSVLHPEPFKVRMIPRY